MVYMVCLGWIGFRVWAESHPSRSDECHVWPWETESRGVVGVHPQSGPVRETLPLEHRVRIHSLKSSLKRNMSSSMSIFLYKQLVFHFHDHFREVVGRAPSRGTRASRGRRETIEGEIERLEEQVLKSGHQGGCIGFWFLMKIMKWWE